MKVEDNGMPEEGFWNSLFDVPGILSWLPISNHTQMVLEIGCGYGTFTIPIARSICGTLCTFDIEEEMTRATSLNLKKSGVDNVIIAKRDVVESGTGLASESSDLVILFNILHFEEKRLLLAEAARILKPGGINAIIHWRKDIQTPRGPAMLSRPDGKQISQAIDGLDLKPYGSPTILNPFHWGMLLIKGSSVDAPNTPHL